VEVDRRLSLVVGAFVIVVVGALAVALTSLTAERSLFTEQYRLVGHFDNALGLLPGAPVWVAGKDVGRVETVNFGALEGAHPITVVLLIDLEVQDRIREGSIATIDTIGLLGDSYVEVSPSPTGEPLGAGSEIVAVSPPKISAVMSKGVSALDDFGTIANDFSTLAEKFGNLAATLDRLVSPFADAEGGARAADAVAALGNIISEVEEGNGLLHTVVYEEYTGGGVESIERSLASLEAILNAVKEGDGILHTLIYESASEQNLLREALAAGGRLNSILGKVDRGEGTLGLLVNDPSVYEDLKVLLDGAQRSAVLRTLIRLSADEKP
jgi:phospholipid/cholesterol/gamma-HCH transport system substrate-binding protein